MNILETAYGRNRAKRINEIRSDIEKSAILNNGTVLKTEIDGVYILDPANENITVWEMPLLFKYDGKPAVIFDSRHYISPTGSIRDSLALASAKTLAMMELNWYTNRDTFQTVTEAAAVVYGHWISRVVGGRYNFNQRQVELSRVALTALYLSYLSEDTETSYSESRGHLYLYKQLTRAGKVPPTLIDEVLGLSPVIIVNGESVEYTILDILRCQERERLSAMLSWITAILNLEAVALTAPLVSNMVVNGSWMGMGATELSLTALEHPPVLISLIHRVQEYSFYERTAIGSAVRECRTKTNIASIKKWLSALSAATETLIDNPQETLED